MGTFAVSDRRKNRVIRIRGPLGLQVVRRLKGDTGPQGSKCDKSDKGSFGSDGKTAMTADLNMANNTIIHWATPVDANDALNKSYVDT